MKLNVSLISRKFLIKLFTFKFKIKMVDLRILPANLIKIRLNKIKI